MLVLPPCDANTIVIAKVGSPIRVTIADLRTFALKLKARTGLNLLATIAALAKAQKKLEL